MTRTTFNKAVVPGLFAFMIDGYKSLAAKQQWKEICSERTSKRAYEEAAYAAGLGLFAHKPEGQAIDYDEMVQGPTKRWTHKTYALNFFGVLKRNFEVIKEAISGNPLIEGNSEERLLCV